jgi:hypothetical protein
MSMSEIKICQQSLDINVYSNLLENALKFPAFEINDNKQK